MPTLRGAPFSGSRSARVLARAPPTYYQQRAENVDAVQWIFDLFEHPLDADTCFEIDVVQHRLSTYPPDSFWDDDFGFESNEASDEPELSGRRSLGGCDLSGRRPFQQFRLIEGQLRNEQRHGKADST